MCAESPTSSPIAERQQLGLHQAGQADRTGRAGPAGPRARRRRLSSSVFQEGLEGACCTALRIDTRADAGPSALCLCLCASHGLQLDAAVLPDHGLTQTTKHAGMVGSARQASRASRNRRDWQAQLACAFGSQRLRNT